MSTAPEHAERGEQDQERAGTRHPVILRRARTNARIRRATLGRALQRAGRGCPRSRSSRVAAPGRADRAAAVTPPGRTSGSPAPPRASSASAGTRSRACSASGSCSQIARRIRKWFARVRYGVIVPSRSHAHERQHDRPRPAGVTSTASPQKVGIVRAELLDAASRSGAGGASRTFTSAQVMSSPSDPTPPSTRYAPANGARVRDRQPRARPSRPTSARDHDRPPRSRVARTHRARSADGGGRTRSRTSACALRPWPRASNVTTRHRRASRGQHQVPDPLGRGEAVVQHERRARPVRPGDRRARRAARRRRRSTSSQRSSILAAMVEALRVTVSPPTRTPARWRSSPAAAPGSAAPPRARSSRPAPGSRSAAAAPSRCADVATELGDALPRDALRRPRARRRSPRSSSGRATASTASTSCQQRGRAVRRPAGADRR